MRARAAWLTVSYQASNRLAPRRFSYCTRRDLIASTCGGVKAMFTFKLPDHNTPVTLPDGLTEDQVLAFHPFKNWVSRLTQSLTLQERAPSHPFHNDPYVLRSITIQSYDLFKGDRLGFLKLTSDVSNGKGESLPGAVFLRGPSVAMLVILVPDDAADGKDKERYVLLTVQPRVAAGSLAFVEIPAGMVDEEGVFAGTAAKEIKEELGLEIPEKDLVCLSELAASGRRGDDESQVWERHHPQALFPSPGASDEYIPIYMHERIVPRRQLSEWTGRLTGLRDEGEKITLRLVPMQDLWREGARDGKTLAALALWEGLRREGKL